MEFNYYYNRKLRGSTQKNIAITINMEGSENPNKIEANLNFGMSTAKQKHCIIQPQILPNLLEHSQKKDLAQDQVGKGDKNKDISQASVVIGTLLGTSDGKMIDISNCFPMTLMNQAKDGLGDNADGDALELAFDTDYVKKMIKFHKTVNDKEQFLGCYISTTVLGKQSMAIVQYFIELLNNKVVNSPLMTPIVLMFDPELTNNKLEIKVRIHKLIYF